MKLSSRIKIAAGLYTLKNHSVSRYCSSNLLYNAFVSCENLSRQPASHGDLTNICFATVGKTFYSSLFYFPGANTTKNLYSAPLN